MEQIIGMTALMLLVIIVVLTAIMKEQESETRLYECYVWDDENETWIDMNFHVLHTSFEGAYRAAYATAPDGVSVMVKEKEKD